MHIQECAMFWESVPQAKCLLQHSLQILRPRPSSHHIGGGQLRVCFSYYQSSQYHGPHIILSLRQRFQKEVSLFDKDVDDDDNCL